MMVARIDDWPIREQARGGFSRSIDSVVNSQFDLPLVAEPAHELDFRENAPGVLDFAPPEFEAAFHAEQECPFFFRYRGRWNVLADQFLGMIQKHSERFSAFLVLQNLTAARIRRVFIDTGDLQRRAVNDHAMTIGARKKNRIVRRYFVQVQARRKNLWFPESLDPTPARDPLAGRRLPDALFHFREKILEAGRA